MFYLLLSLLLTPLPTLAETPARNFSTNEICAAVEYEVNEAVKFGIINEQEASDIIIRCFINYS